MLEVLLTCVLEFDELASGVSPVRSMTRGTRWSGPLRPSARSLTIGEELGVAAEVLRRLLEALPSSALSLGRFRWMRPRETGAGVWLMLDEVPPALRSKERSVSVGRPRMGFLSPFPGVRGKGLLLHLPGGRRGGLLSPLTGVKPGGGIAVDDQLIMTRVSLPDGSLW